MKLNLEKCSLVLWFVWINNKFQKYYKEHTDNFKDLMHVQVSSLSRYRWMAITILFEEEELFDRRYSFGSIHWSNRCKLINKTKAYDDSMLRRVHI